MQIKNKQKGFTLTELAIVLAAVGFLFGGVWVAASVVWDNYNLSRTKEDLFQTVQNVQNYYMQIGALPGGDLISILDDDDRRLIPVSMRSTPRTEGNAINHALTYRSGNSVNGSFIVMRVPPVAPATKSTIFRTTLKYLDQTSCVKLLMQFPILLPEMGVKRMAANANSVDINPHNPADPGSGTTLPLSLSTATAWCNISVTDTNTVSYDFTIRP